jgi:hypothetical protein
MECWHAKNPWNGVLVEPVKRGGSEPFAKVNTAPTTVPNNPDSPNTGTSLTGSPTS